MTTHLLTILPSGAVPGDAVAARALARTLARTVRRHHPDWVTWLCPTGAAVPGEGWFDRVLRPGEAAGEAAALLRLLDAGAGQVFLLHPASLLLGPLAEAAALLKTAPAVLTPRAAEGIGLLALRDAAGVRDWLRAWAERGGPLPGPPDGAAMLSHKGYDLSLGDLDRVRPRFGADGALRVVEDPVRLLHAGGDLPERFPPGWTEPLDLLRWVRAEREDAREADPPARGGDGPTEYDVTEYRAWQAREFARGEAEARGTGGQFRAAVLALARRLPAPARRALRRLRSGRT